MKGSTYFLTFQLNSPLSNTGAGKMSLINASELSKSFGPSDIFQGISLSVPRGARIAIVGSILAISSAILSLSSGSA